MAYGDLPHGAEHKPNKGKEGGACNRARCQAEPALYWNHGSHSWYCADCARDIGEDPVNKRGWERQHQPSCGHPMFETREQMDARNVAKPAPESDFITDYTDLFPNGPPRKMQSASLQRMLKRGRGR